MPSALIGWECRCFGAGGAGGAADWTGVFTGVRDRSVEFDAALGCVGFGGRNDGPSLRFHGGGGGDSRHGGRFGSARPVRPGALLDHTRRGVSA